MSIHSQNEEVILQFGLKKPAFRICVNTPTTHGSIGLTTGLDPAMTLGCGGWGGNITSDNISPRHLLNIKRLAYEVRPAFPASTSVTRGATAEAAIQRLPKAPAAAPVKGISTPALAARIDAFLSSRGIRPSDPGKRERPASPAPALQASEPSSKPGSPSPAPEPPATFVCEDDVRAAIRAGRTLLINDRTIVTPSARDLGESAKVFVQEGWPR
jgi:acetaldehyde dehydrogenase (acetylating)